jgi:hypothetical protein
MLKHVLGLVGLSVLMFVLPALSQKKACNATLVSGVTLDGKLNEPIWTTLKSDTALKQVVLPKPQYLDGGSADNNADCSSDFVLAWDNTNFYCASWFYDDLHYTPNSDSASTAFFCWSDDSHEWWIDADYADIATDKTPEYFGKTGYEIMQGFNMKAGIPKRVAAAYYHGEGMVGYAATTDTMVKKGFDAPYTTVDGINFQSEAAFNWSGDFMSKKGCGKPGDQLAFNLGVNDNDSTARTGYAYMRWTGGDHQNPDGWGKVTLTGEKTKIAPVKVSMVKASAYQEIKGIFDIYGRKIIERNGQQLPGVHFIAKNDAKTVKQIIIR